MYKYPVVVEIDGRSLINFERYTKFMGKVREARLHKPPDLERFRSLGQLAYLEHQLRTVNLDNNHSDDALMTRSLELEAVETRIHNSRARELERLGFRTQ